MTKKLLFVVTALLLAGCGKMPKFDGKDIYAKQNQTCLDTTKNANECKDK